MRRNDVTLISVMALLISLLAILIYFALLPDFDTDHRAIPVNNEIISGQYDDYYLIKRNAIIQPSSDSTGQAFVVGNISSQDLIITPGKSVIFFNSRSDVVRSYTIAPQTSWSFIWLSKRRLLPIVNQ